MSTQNDCGALYVARVYNTLVQGHDYNPEAFTKAAQQFAQQLTPGRIATVVALQGDLGTGKTTFTQEAAKALGVAEDIISPTFVIQKRYQLENQVFGQLIHIDAYRLEGARELEVLGWSDIARDPANLILIEWPEHVEGLLAPETQYIYFEYIDEDTRRISYGKKD
ncbi:tRNA (adenosine(37)-N6)-threonylcarbamoyltransferase complex ATPase subunit type 1 TsaE [bacterium]|nr:tRNA (adenosine(37)-N6)-threonylcarbamoyltransferase complex ATPase subunit type 1 TsaE [bacterium]|tara:strand:- start:1039 stop:1536 length:498 start_codon:yes stop_codon:yes gene_type:complete